MACYQSTLISGTSCFSQWYFPSSGRSTNENLKEMVASSPFAGPSRLRRSLARYRAARFARPNRRACPQATCVPCIPCASCVVCVPLLSLVSPCPLSPLCPLCPLCPLVSLMSPCVRCVPCVLLCALCLLCHLCPLVIPCVPCVSCVPCIPCVPFLLCPLKYMAALPLFLIVSLVSYDIVRGFFCMPRRSKDVIFHEENIHKINFCLTCLGNNLFNF